jgi:FkbM family methyltransferase
MNASDSQVRVEKRWPMLIAGETFPIVGDALYMEAMSQIFEPATTSVLRGFCDDGSEALDIGANIGLTALAFSQFCKKVACIEPVPRTFSYLKVNTAPAKNVRLFNYALGSAEATLPMQGHSDYLAGSYISDIYEVHDGFHFRENSVQVKRLDVAFPEFELDRLDMIKLDVEGYELDVIEGGKQVIGDLRPTVFMEMNHWCLNVFRRISIPEFRERIMKVFPVVFALDNGDYVDYTDPDKVHNINHEHVCGFRYSNLIAGFDRNEIVARLELIRRQPAYSSPPAPRSALDIANDEIECLRGEVERLSRENQEILHSTSWRLTYPLRAIISASRRR